MNKNTYMYTMMIDDAYWSDAGEVISVYLSDQGPYKSFYDLPTNKYFVQFSTTPKRLECMMEALDKMGVPAMTVFAGPVGPFLADDRKEKHESRVFDENADDHAFKDGAILILVIFACMVLFIGLGWCYISTAYGETVNQEHENFKEVNDAENNDYIAGKLNILEGSSRYYDQSEDEELPDSGEIYYYTDDHESWIPSGDDVVDEYVVSAYSTGSVDDSVYSDVVGDVDSGADVSEEQTVDDLKENPVYSEGVKYTWYSSEENTGAPAMDIPGETVDSDGYFRDSDGRLCVASSDYALGTELDTPFGTAVVYDTGCASGIVDVYTDWDI